MSRELVLLVAELGPRPPFYRVAERLWGPGCDIDSDGDSEFPDDPFWTELTIELRATGDRVDVDPVSVEPLVLAVRSTNEGLCQDAAIFIAAASGGSVVAPRREA